MAAETIRDRAAGFLAALGVEAGRDMLLELAAENAAEGLLAWTGRKTLPEELENAAVLRAAGTYLGWKKAGGRLEGFDLERAVKQLQEGDTTVAYESGKSPEERLDGLIGALTRWGQEQLSAYRRVTW